MIDLQHRNKSNLLGKKSNITQFLSSEEKEIIEAMPIFDAEDILSLYFEVKRIEEAEAEENIEYRQNYFDTDSNSSTLLCSTLDKMIEINKRSPEMFRKYSHFKFFQLCQFIEMNKATQ